MATAAERHRGRVLQWEEAGWGAIDSPAFDGPIWAHFSNIEPADRNTSSGGFRRLNPGDAVDFTAERADQDGYRWRATWVRTTG